MASVSGTVTDRPSSSPSSSWAVMLAHRLSSIPGVEPDRPSQEICSTAVIRAVG